MDEELKNTLKEIAIRQHAQSVVTMFHIAGNDTDYFHVLVKGYNNLIEEMLRRGNSKLDFDPLSFFRTN